jgi:hypothetical protein
LAKLAARVDRPGLEHQPDHLIVDASRLGGGGLDELR